MSVRESTNTSESQTRSPKGAIKRNGSELSCATSPTSVHFSTTGNRDCARAIVANAKTNNGRARFKEHVSLVQFANARAYGEGSMNFKGMQLLGTLLLIVFVSGCTNGGRTPPKKGLYGYLSDQNYQYPLQPLDSGAKDGWVAEWQNYGWGQGFSKVDPSAGDFINHPWVDAMIVSAHGDWFPTLGMIPDDWTMQPINNERWLYILACDALSPKRDANDQIIHDQNGNPIPNDAWNQAFGYSLHGVYGYWDPYSGNYGTNYSVAHSIAQNSWVSSGTFGYPTAFDAFEKANVDDTLGWAVIDGIYSHGDSVSAAPDGYVVSGDSIQSIGQLELFMGRGAIYNTYPIPSLTPGSQAQSHALVPESIDENAWIAHYQDSSTTVVRQPGITTVYQTGGAAIHYQNSGGIKYETNSTGTAKGVDSSTALSTANSFIQQNGGMPSDAALRLVAADIVMPLDHSYGPTVVAYVIEYGHSAAVVGYDGIKVKVDDAGYRICIQWDRFRGYCVKWGWQAVPHVSYYYRLWRSLGSPLGSQQTLGFNVPSGTVLSQIPHSRNITRQGFAYYTPPMIFNNVSDQVTPPVQFYEVDNRARLDYDLSPTYLGLGGLL